MNPEQKITDWLNKGIVPYYMMRIKMSLCYLNDEEFKSWQDEMVEDLKGFEVDKLNEAFEAWRFGPKGEMFPNSYDLLELIKYSGKTNGINKRS